MNDLIYYIRKKKHQTIVEYGLIIGLVGIAVLAAINMLSNNNQKNFDTANKTMNKAENIVELAEAQLRDAKIRRDVNTFKVDVMTGQTPDFIPPNTSSPWQNPNAPSGNKPPVAKFIVQPSNSIDITTTVTFLDVSTDPDGDDIVKEEWQNRKSNYGKGTHIVKLRVADEHGNWSSWYQETIEVEDVPHSCKEILAKNVSSKNGEYDVLINNSYKKVYCDMSNGGYTRVSAFDLAKDPNNAPPQLTRDSGWTSPNYAGTPPDAWWAHFNTIANNNFQWRSFTLNNEGVPFKEVKIEYEFVSLWTVDSFNNVHNSGLPDNHSIEGQYADGISITYGNAGNRKHILTYVPNGSPPSKCSWIGSEYTNSPKGTYTKVLPNTTNEKIEVRIMLDQYLTDEDLGIKNLYIWLK